MDLKRKDSILRNYSIEKTDDTSTPFSALDTTKGKMKRAKVTKMRTNVKARLEILFQEDIETTTPKLVFNSRMEMMKVEMMESSPRDEVVPIVKKKMSLRIKVVEE